ncbi:MAG: hypothetical protein GX590_02810 [Lentisphaerae bacterium]|nr:hypothetical protein [Lentisphaerota bacterium]
MAEKKCELEVTLVELALLADAQPAAASRHLLGATLIWPRVGTARKTHAGTLSLARGVWSQASRPWTQRILFKETVQGRFGFDLALTAALADAQAEAFLRALASQVVKFTAGAVEDHLAPPLLGTLAEIPFNYLVKALLKERAPGVLAAGALDVDTSLLPAAGQTVRWEIPMTAPDGLFRMTRRRVGKTLQRRRQTLLPVGGAAGRVVVDVRVL